jgi:hypothetical protein
MSRKEIIILLYVLRTLVKFSNVDIGLPSNLGWQRRFPDLFIPLSRSSITSECTPQSSYGPERTVKMELEGKCAK